MIIKIAIVVKSIFVKNVFVSVIITYVLYECVCYGLQNRNTDYILENKAMLYW